MQLSGEQTEIGAICGKENDLKLPEVLVDFLYIFTAEHRVVIVICIHIPNSSAQDNVGKCLTKV